MTNLLKHYPLILQTAYGLHSVDKTIPVGLRSGCRKWVHAVQELCGIQSTIPNWQRLSRRGLKLSTRLAMLLKRSQSR